MACSDGVTGLNGEEDVMADDAENVPEPAGPEEEPPVTDARTDERPVEPGEVWIEEYESRTKERLKRRIPHLKAVVATVVVVLILLAWTLVSPQALRESGTSFLSNPEYANLGSDQGELEVRWLFEAVYVADTVWGVSISGEQNVSVGEPATFGVLVTKVSEEMKNGWFKGTSINLKRVTMYTEDDLEVGSMVSKSSESFGTIGEVVATFNSAGNHTCHVMVEFTIYGIMVIGYLPVKVLRIETDLGVDICAS
jgi:hypothetical protein